MADFFECSKKTNEIRDKKAQEDDVIAEDYGCPPRSLVNGGILTRINKEIAHLTYTRCGKSLEEKRWDEVFPAIVPDLLRESSQFLEHVKKHYGPQLTTEPMSHIESTLGSLKQCDVDC